MPNVRHSPALLLLGLLTVAPAHAGEPFRFPAGRHGKTGELKYVNELPVLVVSGTPEEMGEAAGALALKPGRRVLDYPRQLLEKHSVGRLWGVFEKAGEGMLPQFPAAYRKELETLAKGADVEPGPVVVGNTFFDLKQVFACSALLVEADRSATGGPLLARNLDYPSLGYIQEYSLVTVYRPMGKHAFVSIGFPGLVGCLSGMNDAGLSLAILEVCDVKDGERPFNGRGIPYAVCHRKVLEECTTIAEARKVLQGLPRTTTLNLVVADRKGVAVFEVTPGRVEQRPARAGVCCCTNHFCTDELRPARPRDIAHSFDRFACLEKVRGNGEKLGPEDLRKQLHAVNLGDETLQTMVFEPATLRLHLAIGQAPSSKLPLRAIDLGPLFKGEDVERGERKKP
jgi:isopenicillin-N N-acyltransferase-like protein